LAEDNPVTVLLSAGRWTGNASDLRDAVQFSNRLGFRLAEEQARRVLVERQR
jgi:hypothetical protein